MTKIFMMAYLLFLNGCIPKSNFIFTSDYRQFPIAVDCEHANDVSLLFEKEGMPTLKINENNVEFKIITSDNGKPRPVCIFENLTLVEFCNYRGEKEVAPYWVPSYQKINTVKCSEVLKNNGEKK